MTPLLVTPLLVGMPVEYPFHGPNIPWWDALIILAFGLLAVYLLIPPRGRTASRAPQRRKQIPLAPRPATRRRCARRRNRRDSW